MFEPLNSKNILCFTHLAQVEPKHIVMQITPNNILAIPLKWCALQCPLQVFFMSWQGGWEGSQKFYVSRFPL